MAKVIQRNLGPRSVSPIIDPDFFSRSTVSAGIAERGTAQRNAIVGRNTDRNAENIRFRQSLAQREKESQRQFGLGLLNTGIGAVTSAVQLGQNAQQIKQSGELGQSSILLNEARASDLTADAEATKANTALLNTPAITTSGGKTQKSFKVLADAKLKELEVGGGQPLRGPSVAANVAADVTAPSGPVTTGQQSAESVAAQQIDIRGYLQGQKYLNDPAFITLPLDENETNGQKNIRIAQQLNAFKLENEVLDQEFKRGRNADFVQGAQNRNLRDDATTRKAIAEATRSENSLSPEILKLETDKKKLSLSNEVKRQALLDANIEATKEDIAFAKSLGKTPTEVAHDKFLLQQAEPGTLAHTTLLSGLLSGSDGRVSTPEQLNALGLNIDPERIQEIQGALEIATAADDADSLIKTKMSEFNSGTTTGGGNSNISGDFEQLYTKDAGVITKRILTLIDNIASANPGKPTSLANKSINSIFENLKAAAETKSFRKISQKSKLAKVYVELQRILNKKDLVVIPGGSGFRIVTPEEKNKLIEQDRKSTPVNPSASQLRDIGIQ